MSIEAVSLLVRNFDEIAKAHPDIRDIAGYTLQEWADYAVIGWDDRLTTYFVSFGDYGEGREIRWSFSRKQVAASPYLLGIYVQSMIPAVKFRFSMEGIRILMNARAAGAHNLGRAFSRIDQASAPAFYAISDAADPSPLLIPPEEVLELFAIAPPPRR